MNSKAPTAVGPSQAEGRQVTRSAMKSELHTALLVDACSTQLSTQSGAGEFV